MLNEHAITYKDRLSVADLNYLIRKANKLGKCSREVIRVYQQEDCEGIHVYFETTGLHYQVTHESRP